MTKLIDILAVSAILMQAGCSCNLVSRDAGANQENIPQTTTIATTPAHPIAFARYETILPDSAALAEQDFRICQSSAIFVVPTADSLNTRVDFCGPSPKLAGGDFSLPKPNSSWQLPLTPNLFIWQQHLQHGQDLRLELLDSDGLPWPAITTVSQKNSRYTVQLKPEHELPKMRELFLIGTIYDQDGKKVETWLEPFWVSEGVSGQLPWMSAPQIIVAKHRRHKRLRK